MRRVLVTGGTGFVGANLVRRLLRDGHEVHVLVQPAYTTWRIADVRRDIRLARADLDDAAAVDAAVRRARPEWVFHLAAYGAYSWQEDFERIMRTNVHGTVHLVRAALRHGAEAIVNAGSSSEYGLKDHAPHEREWLDPNSHYALTKAAATQYCRYTSISEDVHLVTLRLYSVYGPWEEPGRLMPAVVVYGLGGRLPPLADPDVARDFVYTDDVCDAFVRAASRRGQARGAVYNIGTGRQTTLRQVVAAARRALGVRARPVWGSMANRRWDTTVWVSDPRAARRALGWRARTTLETGLRRMATWLEQNPGLASRYRAEILRPAPPRRATR
ncbi:MAG TPA: SDR family NAD(P)-dependent oxidoreductase [Candidatus Limnocylindria bacterium]|nr:SDR family NAD(P)-dependent oxidoreductase [Candidatus Limnocylindria bacterium]